MSDLPRCMYEKNGSFYLVKKNKWTLLGKQRERALERYTELTRGIPRDIYLAAYRRAKNNAATRALEFLLSTEDYHGIIRRAAGVCELTRIPFSLDNPTLSRRRPFAPSLDRINSALPYTSSNCRLVAVCVNAALSDWGEEVFRRLVAEAKLTSPP